MFQEYNMKTRIAIVDTRMPDAYQRRLMMHGWQVIALPPCPRLGDAIASHPDMLIASVGGEMVTSADYCEVAGCAISEIYDNLHVKFHFTSDIHGKDYPADVLFNSLTLGDKLYGRLDSLSPYLLKLARDKGLTPVNVRQGYPACTVLKLSENAVITADEGAARVLRADGVRVYVIERGGVSLPPYEYGFIGGAAGRFGSTVYFIGNPATHPSWNEIKSALDKEGLSFVALGDGPLLDLGGIIFAEGDVN